MKYEEYVELSKGLSDANTQADTLVKLMDALKEDTLKKESLEIENNKLQEQNNMLRDTNTKLALRVTGAPEKPEDKPEEELEGVDALNALVNKIKEDK